MHKLTLVTYTQGSHASWNVLDFNLKFTGPERSWKMSLVLESPGNYSLRCWKLLVVSNYTIGIVPSLGCCLMKHSGNEYWTVQSTSAKWQTCDECSAIHPWIVLQHSIFWVGNCHLSLHLNIAVPWQHPGKTFWESWKVLEFFRSKRVWTLYA